MRPCLAGLLLGLFILSGCAKVAEKKLDVAAARNVHKILLLEPPAQVGGFVQASFDPAVAAALKARGFSTRQAFTEAMQAALREVGYQVETRHILHLAPHPFDSYAGIETDADAIFDVVEVITYNDRWSFDYVPDLGAQARLARVPDGQPLYEFIHPPQLKATAAPHLPIKLTPEMRLTDAELHNDPARVEAAIRAVFNAGAHILAASLRPAS